MSKKFLWVEKYRPATIAECVLPERIKSVFQGIVDSGEVPNMILSGSAGVGKTTAAIAMCKEIGLNHLFINSSKERGIDTLRTKISGYASTISLMEGKKKVIILDEADYLTPEAQAALRGVIEEFSANCTFIFTCNFKSRLIDAIHSRCPVIDFTLKKGEKLEMAKGFMKRMEHILKEENVVYEKVVLAKFMEKYFPDYRRIIGELQWYAKSGNIDAGVIAQLDDVQSLNVLIDALRKKNFTAMRTWVVNNSDVDPVRIYRKIYDSMYSFFKPESIPQAVVILGKYQYQSAFVADQEINLVACLTEIMVDCEVA